MMCFEQTEIENVEKYIYELQKAQTLLWEKVTQATANDS